jgi:hypothetical protein
MKIELRHVNRLAAASSRRFARPIQNAARTRRLNGVILAFVVLLSSFTLAQIREEMPAPPVVRFTNVDVLVDPRGTPLAAYQVEFIADPARVTLVGIEGGQDAAFKQPPYYDPKAMSGNRVILAALNTGKDLPRQKTRVARLHLRIIGAEQPKLSAKLIVAASSNEKTIQADVSVSEGAGQ